MRLLLVLLLCYCRLPCLRGAKMFNLLTCAHDFRPALAARQPCYFTPAKGSTAKKKKETLVCPLAANPDLQLPRGITQPCALRGTGFVVAPDAALYVDEVVKAVLGAHIRTFKGQADGSEYPPGHMRHVLSMVGFRRLHNVQSLLEDAIFRGVPGDFIETGVWRGGLCLVAAALFQAYGQFPQRNVWLADSFKGLPPSTWRVDKLYHKNARKFFVLRQNSMQAVQDSFLQYGLLSNSIRWLPGYFNETLPKAREQWTSFAVIRLDGDLYQSVYESFVNLYPFLSPGGYAIIDDYWDWPGARLATDTFLRQRRIAARLLPAYHGPTEEIRGAWFQKPP